MPPNGDVDGLDLGIQLEAVVIALATQAAKFGAAKGGAQVAHVVRIDPDHARLDGLGDTVTARQVVGPNVARQAVLNVVGDVDGLGLVVEGDDDQNRSKDFFLCHAHGAADVGDQGRT